MKLKTWLAGMVAAVPLGIVAVPAQAAPVGGISDLKGAAAQTADVQQAQWYGRRRYYRHYDYGPRFRRDRPRNRFQRWQWRNRHIHGW
jgi:hypothetical protein